MGYFKTERWDLLFINFALNKIQTLLEFLFGKNEEKIFLLIRIWREEKLDANWYDFFC